MLSLKQKEIYPNAALIYSNRRSTTCHTPPLTTPISKDLMVNNFYCSDAIGFGPSYHILEKECVV